MKKKINKKGKQTHHHWYNVDMTLKTLFWGLILLLIIVHTLNTIDDKINENKEMYHSCLDACTEKPYYWIQSPKVVNVGDRVECIRVCNSFHHNLK